MFFHVAFGNTREYLHLEPVQLGVFLISGTPRHGGPGVRGMYLPIPPVFSPEPCEYIIAALSKKGVSAWFYTDNERGLWKLCWRTPQSAAHCVFLAVRKMSAVRRGVCLSTLATENRRILNSVLLFSPLALHEGGTLVL